MHHSYVSRLENDAFRSPSPEKLRKVAEVLDLNQGDVFALAGYHRPADLPSFAPYLRAKYQMSDEDMERITDYFSLLQEKHGIVDRPPRELAVHEPEVDRTTVSWQDL